MSEHEQEHEQERNPIDAELLRDMAALVGVELATERVAGLATQAAPHFAQLRALNAVADPATEPAAAFRLDDWVSGADA